MTQPPRRPNLLFLMTDQQRADTIDPDGPCRTPNLQALARDGVRFERCYAPNPICSPTRASLFTGLLPHAHGVTDVTHAVPPSRAKLEPDLPFWTRTLRDAGYRTALFGKWHVERSDELERFGIDEYEVDLRLTGVKQHEAPLLSRVDVRHDGYLDLPVAGVSETPAEETREAELFSKGIDFLRDAAASEPDRPWALVISTEAPHDPYVAPKEYYDRYDPATLPLPASFGDDLRDRPGIYRRIQRSWDQLSRADFAEATACYYALCSLIDDQVGRILEVLRETGQEEDTIVVFTSDHGDYLGAHRLMMKGVPAFEEAYRVPLAMRGPGIHAGVTVPGPVSLLDLAPTLVRLATGGDFPGHGRDLTGRLRDPSPSEASASPPDVGPGATSDETREEAPLAANEAFAEFHGQRLGYTQRILWRGRYKYVFNGFDFDELYDLEADPHELRNLADADGHAAVARTMAARMWRIVRDTGDTTLGDAQYGMFRFAPVGPEAADEENRSEE